VGERVFDELFREKLIKQRPTLCLPLSAEDLRERERKWRPISVACGGVEIVALS